MIEKNEKYKIKGNSPYFTKKYRIPNPEIVIEGLWKDITGKSWMFSDGNPAAMLYGMRAGLEGLPIDDDVYYGKIYGMGELVHSSELK